MAKNRTQNVLTLVLMGVALSPPFSIDAMAESVALPQAVTDWVEQQVPHARILVREDIDVEDCGQVQHPPGIVAADFDGDGGQDLALILVVGKVKNVSHWHGRTFRTFDMRVTVLMSKGHDGFKKFELEHGQLGIPASVLLEPQPPHQVSGGGLNPHQLDRPGFVWHYCGKSSSVIHWENGKLVRIWTSD